MRRAIWMILVVSAFGCARPHIVRQEFDSSRVRPLMELKTVTDVRELNNWVGYLDKGDSIPLKLNLESEWLGIRQDRVDLIVKRRIYVRVSIPKDFPEERLREIIRSDANSLSHMSAAERAKLFQGVMLYLSDDAAHWAPLNDLGAIKEVFDIKGGTVSAGAGMNDTEGVWAALTVKMLGKK